MSASAFLRNAWYVAATSAEVGAVPFARRICGEDVMLFRRADGSIAALEDRCPHRKAPLSKGAVIGDEIQCGYHGVRFDGSGTCTHIPSQAQIPGRGFRARAYPAVERHALIFVWTGEPAKADDRSIPDFSENTNEGSVAVHGYHYVKGNYQLLIDNLLDLTHLPFVHKTTLGATGKKGQLESPLEVEVKGDRVHTKRIARNQEKSIFSKATRMFAEHELTDRIQTTVFTPPCFVHIVLGMDPPNLGLTEPQHVHHQVLNALTPETETTCHYFWSVPRRICVDDPVITKMFKDITQFAFDEDQVMIEAQQKMIDSDTSDVALVNFQGDRASFEARRIIARKLEEESKHAAAA
jgi:vanillate O-demethylase monooxygenase subunit